MTFELLHLFIYCFLDETKTSSDTKINESGSFFFYTFTTWNKTKNKSITQKTTGRIGRGGGGGDSSGGEESQGMEVGQGAVICIRSSADQNWQRVQLGMLTMSTKPQTMGIG